MIFPLYSFFPNVSNMKDEKSFWIKALENDSWHAELIASGLAIYGSLAMGPFLDEWAQYLSVYFNERTLNYMYYAFMYLFMAQSVLSVGFIAHLCLRILWVGLLGLASVFPDGIPKEHKTYKKEYLDDLRKEFPDLSAYSMKVDKVCSTVFSVLCMIVMISIAYFFWIVVFILISYLLNLFLDDRTIGRIASTIATLFIVIVLLLSVTSMKRFQDNKLVQSIGLKPGKFVGKILFPILNKPMGYIMNTLATNTHSTKFAVSSILVPLVSMLFMVSHLEKIVPFYNDQGKYFKINYREGKADSENYLNSLKGNYIRQIVIQEEKIADNYLVLFIPYFERERPFWEKECGALEEKSDTLSKKEKRILERKYYDNCANQYYKVFLNDQQVYADFTSRYHEHNGEWGFETYIPLDGFERGRHVIRVDSKFEYEGEFSSRYIPFLKVQ